MSKKLISSFNSPKEDDAFSSLDKNKVIIEKVSSQDGISENEKSDEIARNC